VLTAACGETRLTTTSVPTGVGPDAILLRVPRGGGVVRAYRAGRDSVLWESRTDAPRSTAVLGFDDFQGLLIARDAAGHAYTVDLRLGGIETLGTAVFAGPVVAEGSAVFGRDAQGRIVRVTPAATWSWKPAGTVDALIPNPDGALVVVSTAAGRSRVNRLLPPETRLNDSTTLPHVREMQQTLIGDRIWFDTDSGLIALRTRDLTRALSVRMTDAITVIETTPSGDRLYVGTGDASLRVIDRFAERESGRIPLPAPAVGLRRDPDGRYLLVRVASSDSILVVSVGTERVVSTLEGAWRDDLPLVTPDGRVLLARGNDVVHVDAETGRERLRYRGGASDLWFQARWNGFRPRAAGLDQPVEFEEYASDSAAADSALAAMMAARYGDATSRPSAPLPPFTPAPEDRGDVTEPTESRQGRETWTVSFATLLAEDRAREMAERIRVDGRTARVVASNRDGIPIWRVVLGPYDNRDSAERAGMASRLPYWVFEGVP
jgi:hypothetical protein